MRPLHLLEVGLSWPPEAYLRRKLEALADLGIRVTVAAQIDRRGARQRLRGVRLIRLPRWDESRLIMALGLLRDGLALAIQRPRALARLLRAVRRIRLLRAAFPILLANADVVHFEWESSGRSFLQLFEVFGAPVVVSSHGGINIRPQLGDERMAASYPLIFKKATAVHCVCEAVVRTATRYGLDPSKARVIRTAVDTDFFAPGPKVRADRFRIVAVGELNFIKGYSDAIKAIACLVAQGVPISFDVIGGEPAMGSHKPSDRPRLLYLIDELGLHDRVRLRGELSQDQVRDCLRESDVLLHPSLSEGLPNAVLEAMACALPVVVTDCGGLREAVGDGVEGFVCPRRSPAALAAALCKLWFDPEQARRMGEAGRARVLSEFGLRQQIESFVRFYESLNPAYQASITQFAGPR